MIKQIINIEEARKLWNEEIGFIYPLSKELFSQNITNYKNAFIYGYYEDEELLGFIVFKKPFDNFIKDYSKKAWISLIYVKENSRKKGIGSMLITKALKELKDYDEVRVGGDLFNFFPGVPDDFLVLMAKLLTKFNFSVTGECYDMINLNLQKHSYRGETHLTRYLTKEDLPKLKEFITAAFPGRWEFEVCDYIKKGGTGKEFLCTFIDDKIVGYIRVNKQDNVDIPYNTNWKTIFGDDLVGLGPLGVSKEYRKLGIGYNLLVKTFNTLVEEGYRKALIDWTGLVPFYQKFGFQTFKRFVYFVYKRK